MGGPVGIGPEIIIKSPSRAGLVGAPMVMVGCVRTLRCIMAMNITPQVELHVVQKVYDAHFAPGVTNVMGEPLANPDALTPGVVQAATGDLAHHCTKRATALALSDEVRAITTAPLNKETLYLGEHNYPGYAELLAHLAGSREYTMVLYTNRLKVIHISTHISLRKLLDTLNGEGVKTVVRVASHFLKRIGIERPRIAVAGVNPHAGEHSLFGTEEIEVIVPTIEAMQTEDIDAIGPCPPDIVFMQCHERLFDMVVTMYHDQGYIPLKLLGFYDGVDITAGLPFIRTSVDHGTTFGIAWIREAKPENMAISIQSVTRISRE